MYDCGNVIYGYVEKESNELDVINGTGTGRDGN